MHKNMQDATHTKGINWKDILTKAEQTIEDVMDEKKTTATLGKTLALIQQLKKYEELDTAQ